MAKIAIRDQIRRGQRAQGTALRSSDVGRLLSLGEGFGTVQAADVGRRVWHKPYGLIMESKEQRDARQRKPTKNPRRGRHRRVARRGSYRHRKHRKNPERKRRGFGFGWVAMAGLALGALWLYKRRQAPAPAPIRMAVSGSEVIPVA
jgi:hypothetical protein